jgi:H+/Cl- antiporter ClcA
MSIPSFFFGSIIATICGLLFHLLRGGRLSRMLLYIATAWVSFFAGQLVSEWISWRVLCFGSLNILPDLIATLIGLMTAHVLAGQENSSDTSSRKRIRRRK